MIVKSVKDGTIEYENGWDNVQEFMDGVEEGSYVLIGACHPLHA